MKFSHSRLSKPVLSIAILCLRKHQIQSQSMHFSKIFWRGMPPDPPRRLMLRISECASHTAGEPTYTFAFYVDPLLMCLTTLEEAAPALLEQ